MPKKSSAAKPLEDIKWLFDVAERNRRSERRVVDEFRYVPGDSLQQWHEYRAKLLVYEKAQGELRGRIFHRLFQKAHFADTEVYRQKLLRLGAGRGTQSKLIDLLFDLAPYYQIRSFGEFSDFYEEYKELFGPTPEWRDESPISLSKHIDSMLMALPAIERVDRAYAQAYKIPEGTLARELVQAIPFRVDFRKFKQPLEIGDAEVAFSDELSYEMHRVAESILANSFGANRGAAQSAAFQALQRVITRFGRGRLTDEEAGMDILESRQ